MWRVELCLCLRGACFWTEAGKLREHVMSTVLQSMGRGSRFMWLSRGCVPVLRLVSLEVNQTYL